MSLALTQPLYAQGAPEVATPLGPPRAFKPSDGFIAPSASRYNFCPAALSAKSFDPPPKQIFEGDTGWFFQLGEIDWSPPLKAGLFQDVSRMRAMLAQQGTKLVIVVPPPRGLTNFAHLPPAMRGFNSLEFGARLRMYLSLVEKLRDAGAIVPDILDEARRQNIPVDRVMSPADVHWTATGAWISSLAVARAITPQRLRGGLPPLIGTPGVLKSDSYTDVLNRICGLRKAPKDIGTFTPVPSEAASEGDLLGTSQAADIVLVGTSFSAFEARYNFAPYVQNYTGLTTLNLAIAGGGPLTSLKQYTTSEDFRTSKPKYLIWEFTPSSLPDTSFADERGGVLRSACAANYPMRKAVFQAGIKPIVTAADIARATLGESPIQLELRSDNAGFRAFTVYYDYADGRQDTVDLDTRRATNMDPNYTLILPQDHALITGISVVNDEPLTGQVTAQLCPATDIALNSPSTSPSWLGRVAAWFKSFWS